MVNYIFKIAFLFFWLVNSTFFLNAQKLFIPINDSEIISIYKSGDKQDDGSYISKDKSGNIRIQGKFNKLIPVGKWYIFFKNGKLQSTYSYSEEGKLDGVFVQYFSNGKIYISGNFKNNIQTGLWRTFYLNGNIETEGEMLEGKRYKQWNYYHNSGKIKEVSNYNFEGKLDGDLISFDEYGTLVSKANYKKNKIDGEYLEYYYDGNIALRGYYILGYKDSVWTEYQPYKVGFNRSVNISFEKRYKNDLPHSNWIYYYPNSNYIQKEETYRDGLKNGTFKEYFYNNRISKVINYTNNFLNGEYLEYLPSGQKSVVGEYQNGLKVGIWETYREDGSLFSVGNYENDLEEGDWKYFHRSGNLSSEGKYSNGFKISQWIYYYDSGNLDEIGSYLSGLKHDLWGRFYENGNLKQEEEYSLGKLLNISNFYLKDESIIENKTFKDGNGLLYDYYENGKLFSISNYKNGSLEGAYEEYHINGKISKRGKYSSNTKKGEWLEFSKRGLLKKKIKHD
tara:strand:- start:316 stop:1839 length:1524 start_codon:yes stop_codon:yes gene_type:complete